VNDKFLTHKKSFFIKKTKEHFFLATRSLSYYKTTKQNIS